jgi:diguanylate cyclase (GGDEF)-like protein/PAS domain S-box-containing protein
MHKSPDPFASLAEQIDRITSQLGDAEGEARSGTAAGGGGLHEALVAMASEVRERREAEATLRRSEAHFRLVVERMVDVVLLLDRDGTIQYASPSLATAIGQRPEDVTDRSLVEQLHPDDASVFRAGMTRAFERPGESNPCELRLRGRDGEWLPFEALVNRMIDPVGRQLIVVVARSSAERKRAERALRESEERHALAFHGSGDGLWDWDLENDRVFYSSRWKAMGGYSEDEIGDHSHEWLGRVHAEDLEHVKAGLGNHAEGRSERFQAEYRFQMRDGSYRWMLARGTALRGHEGKATRMVGSQTDVTDRKASEELLLHQAVHDALTGLPRRAALLERLERSLARAQRAQGYLFGVLFLDIDRFKLVNDSLGHLAGDQLLVAIARRLTASLRPGDMVAHLGGDEFAILVDHISRPGDATYVADRIQRDLGAPFTVGGQDVYASASIGIALSSGGYERPEELLRDSDTAMYRAKALGSGRYELFDQAMHARALSRLKLETDLRRALERQELRLHYQPIVSLDNGVITGFEALVRWQHPERGLLAPAEFLPVAEETGLIVPMCTWVVREACRRTRAWQTRFPGRRLSISTNLTSTHFTEADVMHGIEDALRETGLEGRDLVIEITESVMMKEFDAVIAVLLALKGLEIQLHIDDFGTGYSSLSYLHSLPVDALKIDRSFVARMGQGPGDDVIVRTIIEMAHNLGRHVIAEGIETPLQLARLRDLGCEFGQGFFFSRPVDEAGVIQLLTDDRRW